MIVGISCRKRRGMCEWCERDKQALNYTVYVRAGDYHAAMVCQRCLNEYRENLKRKLEASGFVC